MQKRYTTKPKSEGSFFKVIAFICFIIFMTVFIYGTVQVLNEIKFISESQRTLIANLTDKNEKKPGDDPVEGVEGETVSKVEFVRFRNETNRTIREMSLEIQRIQSKLKIKRTSLKKN
jgi:hypothetical protein